MNLSLPHVLPVAKHPVLSLRPLAAADSPRVFAWRNSPSIVAMSASRRFVTRDEHEAWIASSLKSAERLVFIIELNGSPAGLLRFDGIDTCEAEISIYLTPEFVGRGAGTEAIRAGCELLWTKTKVVRVLAWVRQENERSHTAFAKAGFQTTSEQRSGQIAWARRFDRK